MPPTILVVDDEADIRDLVAGLLEDEGYHPLAAAGDEEAFRVIDEERPDLVILDVWLRGSEFDGLAILDRIKTTRPSLPVVIMSGHGDGTAAADALRRGAAAYVTKPFTVDDIMNATESAIRSPQAA